ncbi:hypothetical protein QUC31_011325 [Theobroma cacao]
MPYIIKVKVKRELKKKAIDATVGIFFSPLTVQVKRWWLSNAILVAQYLEASLSGSSEQKGQLLVNPIQNFETMPTSSILFSLFLCLLAFSTIADGEQVILVNNCKESIWPGTLGGAGQVSPKDGGFHLGSGEEVVLDVPQKWSGRIWGRQGCNFDSNGKGSCETGDCSGMLHCQGKGGTPPATVIEMTLGSSSSPLHFYDVSLVDGFNLPVSMKPVGGGIGCGVASCEVDLNVCCPSALEVKKGAKVVGCKSACLAMQSAKYCCTGEYANPNTCKPTLFAHLFKAICPKAYSYAFDDSSSLNKCRASRYVITFCPPQ